MMYNRQFRISHYPKEMIEKDAFLSSMVIWTEPNSSFEPEGRPFVNTKPVKDMILSDKKPCASLKFVSLTVALVEADLRYILISNTLFISDLDCFLVFSGSRVDVSDVFEDNAGNEMKRMLGAMGFELVSTERKVSTLEGMISRPQLIRGGRRPINIKKLKTIRAREELMGYLDTARCTTLYFVDLRLCVHVDENYVCLADIINLSYSGEVKVMIDLFISLGFNLSF
jgi:hypothetical protein